jgi:hypothetical protein
MTDIQIPTETVTSVNARRGAGHNAPNEAVKAEVAPPAANATAVYHMTSIPEKYCTPITISNKEFIEGIFHDLPDNAKVLGCAFDAPPDQSGHGVWFTRELTDKVLLRTAAFIRGQHNTFYTVSSFYPDAEGKFRRRKVQVAATHVLTLDDIGSGPSAKIPWSEIKLPPSFIIETSPDNAQVGYIFSTSLTDGDLFNRLVNAMIFQGLHAEADPGMVGLTRLVRLPVGLNNKTKYDPPHSHVCWHWEPELQYVVDDIVQAYDLVLDPPKPKQQFRPGVKLTADDDPWLQVLSDLGLILTGEVRSGGDFQMVDILCPFHEEHPDRMYEGTIYVVGTHGFKCQHGTCANRRFTDVKVQLATKYGVDVEAVGARARAARATAQQKETMDVINELKALRDGK